MIFLLIQASICKQIFSRKQTDNKNLLLYIDSHDIIEISINSGYGVFFSKWDDFDNLKMDVYSLSGNNNRTLLQEFGSKNGLIGIAYQNSLLQIRNEGETKYKLFVMICKEFPSYYELRKIPEWVSMPIVDYIEKATFLNEFKDLKSPYIIGYDSYNSKCLTVNVILMIALGIISLGYSLYFFCKS